MSQINPLELDHECDEDSLERCESCGVEICAECDPDEKQIYKMILHNEDSLSPIRECDICYVCGKCLDKL